MSFEEGQTQAPVVSKAELQTALRQAIARLETLAAQLDEREGDRFPLGEDCAAVNASLERLSAALATAEPATATVAPTEPEPEATAEPDEAAVESPPATPPLAASLWQRLLSTLRGWLPAGLSDRLSARALAGLAIAMLVFAFIVTTNLFPGGEPAAPEVAESPPAPVTVPAPEAAPAAPEAVAPTPEPQPQSPAAPEPEPVAAPEPPEPAPAPKPARKLRLTPEQKLIAAIQNQVAEITDDYADGLIRSIRADFVGDQLVVTVGEEWYSLPAARQDQLASEMLARSRQLDFSKLEIENLAGDRLARSPVVGNQMVIFQRVQT